MNLELASIVLPINMQIQAIRSDLSIEMDNKELSLPAI